MLAKHACKVHKHMRAHTHTSQSESMRRYLPFTHHGNNFPCSLVLSGLRLFLHLNRFSLSLSHTVLYQAELWHFWSIQISEGGWAAAREQSSLNTQGKLCQGANIFRLTTTYYISCSGSDRNTGKKSTGVWNFSTITTRNVFFPPQLSEMISFRLKKFTFLRLF